MKKILAVFAITIIIAYCANIQKAYPENQKNPGGKQIIIVLDKSVSMLKSDPEKYRNEAAQLSIALAKQTDSLAIIAFSDEADIIRPLKEIANNSEKNNLQEKAFSIVGGRMTNFMAPLQRIIKMLPENNTGGTIIFLTDGDHNMAPTQEDILEKVKLLGTQGWRFYTVALQEKDAKPSVLLKQMGPLTGGANFNVNNAEDLIETYLRVSNDIQHMLKLEFKDKITTNVYPGVRRLMLVTIPDPKEGPLKKITASIDWLRIDLTGENVYQYPNQKLLDSGVNPKIQIINIDNPRASKWSFELNGKAKRAFLLEEPPFAFNMLKLYNEYYDGQEIDLGIDIDSYEKSLPESLAKNTKITAEIVSDSNPANRVMNIPVQITSDGKKTLSFRGKAVCHLSKPGIPENFNVFYRIAIADSDNPELIWQHEKATSFTLKPWDGELQVLPKELIKTCYAKKDTLVFSIKNSSPLSVESALEITADKESIPVKISLKESLIKLAAGEKKDVSVILEEPAEGIFRATLHAKNNAHTGVKDDSALITVTFVRPRVMVKEEILDFGTVIAGDGSLQKQLTVSTNVPGENAKLVFEMADLKGPGGNKISAKKINVITPGNERITSKESPVPFFFTAETGSTLPNGEYKGTIEFSTSSGEHIAITIPVILRIGEKEITADVRELSFSLQAGTGSRPQTISVGSNTKEKINAAAEVSGSLEGEGDSKGQKLDAAVIGFDNNLIQLNREEPGKFAVRIKDIPAETASGIYRGTIIISSQGCKAIEIPVTLIIKPVKLSFDSPVDFGQLIIGEKKKMPVTIKTDAESPIIIEIKETYITGPDDLKIPVTVSESRPEISEKKSAAIEIKIDTTSAKPGEYSGEMVCAGPDKKEHVIKLTAKINAPSFETPLNEIAFAAIAGSNSNLKTVTVRTNSPVPVAIKHRVEFAGPYKNILEQSWRSPEKDTVAGPGEAEISGRFVCPAGEQRFDLKPGTYKGALYIYPGDFEPLKIELVLQVVPLEITTSHPEIKFGQVIYGGKVKAKLSVLTNHDSAFPIKIQPASLTGDKDTIKIDCDTDTDTNISRDNPAVFNFSVKAGNALPGLYTGEIKIAVPDGTTKTIPAELEITAPEFTLYTKSGPAFVPGNKLKFEMIAGNKSGTTAFRVKTNSLAPVHFDIEKASLKSSVQGTPDIQAELLITGSGQFTIDSGSDADIEISIGQLNASVADGLYHGILLLKSGLGEPLKINIETEVGPLKYSFNKKAVSFGQQIAGIRLSSALHISTNSSRPVIFKLSPPSFSAPSGNQSSILPKISVDLEEVKCNNEKESKIVLTVDTTEAHVGSYRGQITGIGENHVPITIPIEIDVIEPVISYKPREIETTISRDEIEKTFVVTFVANTPKAIPYVCEITRLNGTTFEDTDAELMPDVTFIKDTKKLAAISLSPRETKQELRIALPENIVPGTYKGTMRLSPDNKQGFSPIEINFVITVPSTWWERNWKWVIPSIALLLLLAILGFFILRKNAKTKE